ncbi:FixH family protein [Arenimonas sp.]|uniref:FixH family protein n=1 Tax=Arenimonas sp. TaxID=1872635 RepID=UPI0025F10D1A|nr:FixH family protein [Arenimonas sp.]
MGEPGNPGPSRNYALWLVLGIPAATVVAGIWTIVAISSESGVDADPDPVRRTAQVQVVSIEADQAAATRGLSARVEIDGGGALVRLGQSTGPVAPRLQLIHPIESSLDRQIELAPHPQGWRANEPVAARHGWQLRLVAADGSWRVVGRYHPGDTTVELVPSVAAP